MKLSAEAMSEQMYSHTSDCQRVFFSTSKKRQSAPPNPSTPMSASEEPSQVSEFYLACRNGDKEFVKDYLKKCLKTGRNPNYIDPQVKSTPLHTASHHGHEEIVQLLLEYQADRSLLNGHGVSAYEVAANNKIRQLYKRPISSAGLYRFQDENTDGYFDFVKEIQKPTEEQTTASIPHSSTKRTPTVQGYCTDAEKQLEVGYATTSITMCQSKVGRFIADSFQRGAPMSLKSMGSKLQELVDEEITAQQDPQSERAHELLQTFLKSFDRGNVEHLIRLYTMETKFYYALQPNPIPLALPLYRASESLKERYFQGISYRGTKIDSEDIVTYQRIVNNPAGLLQTRHFFSTSQERSIAEEFLVGRSESSKHKARKPALLIFHFPEKCDQTVDLSRLSSEYPCLSEFEDEKEVLILPWALFHVDSIEEESSSLIYIINLTNVILPHTDMWSSLKWILTHPKGCIDRFNEHFREREPENVVTEMMNNFPVTDERF